MKILNHLAHLFIPRESNNQKAKILHNSSLILLVLGLICFQFFLSSLPRLGPQILGFAANISPDEVVRLTNEKRAENGLAPLTIDPLLTQAAQAKGADMLNKGYWAHVAPDGTTPWKFFTDAGYQYRYAGENLARDFSNPGSAIDAWMNSPSHKENLLSSKYKDIGVAVVEGKLNGVDTTIIVQLFGAKYTAATQPSVPSARAQTAVLPTTAPAVSLPSPSFAPAVTLPAGQETLVRPLNLISPFTTTKGLSLAVVAVLLAVLLVDTIITSKKAIVRVGGRTFAHFAFLGMIVAIILILRAGQII